MELVTSALTNASSVVTTGYVVAARFRLYRDILKLPALDQSDIHLTFYKLPLPGGSQASQ